VGSAGSELSSADEAIAALRALGYTLAEAEQALRGVPPAGKASTEERLATALRGR
jgi:Holliday junction resolvasome RuvABC DNA-binding subunit